MVTFGIFLLIVGLILFSGGAVRLLFLRSRGGAWKFPTVLASIGCLAIASGLYLLEMGQGEGGGRVAIGATSILVGLGVIGIGLWLGVWAPIGAGTRTSSLSFLIIGLLLCALGIIVLVLPFESGPRYYSTGSGLLSLDFGRRIGSVPFGGLVIVVMLLVNGIGIRNGLRASQILGANIITVALLFWVYMLADRYPWAFPFSG